MQEKNKQPQAARKSGGGDYQQDNQQLINNPAPSRARDNVLEQTTSVLRTVVIRDYLHNLCSHSTGACARVTRTHESSSKTATTTKAPATSCSNAKRGGFPPR